MSHFSKAVEWLAYYLPEISNLSLAVLGVWMSFPEKAEKIEKNPFSRKLISYTCVVVGVAGFAASMHQKRQADSDMRTLIGNTNTLVSDTSNLIKNTNATVINTNNLALTLSVLVPRLD
jgi:hypothetical protein